MTKNKLFKHDNNTEVALFITRIVYISEKLGYKVKGSWINIVNKDKQYPIGIIEEVFVTNDQIKNWKEIQ